METKGAPGRDHNARCRKAVACSVMLEPLLPASRLNELLLASRKHIASDAKSSSARSSIRPLIGRGLLRADTSPSGVTSGTSGLSSASNRILYSRLGTSLKGQRNAG